MVACCRTQLCRRGNVFATSGKTNIIVILGFLNTFFGLFNDNIMYIVFILCIINPKRGFALSNDGSHFGSKNDLFWHTTREYNLPEKLKRQILFFASFNLVTVSGNAKPLKSAKMSLIDRRPVFNF